MILLRRLLDALLALFRARPPQLLPATRPEETEDDPTDPGSTAPDDVSKPTNPTRSTGDTMPDRVAMIARNIPVYDASDTTSAKIGTVSAGTELPYLGQKQADDAMRSVWFNVRFDGRDAWIVAESGGTYATLEEATEPVPAGEDWDVLLSVATTPSIAAARYGFTADRRGGAQEPNPEGYTWPRSPYNNCVTWIAQALQLGRHAVGLGGEMSRDDWATILVWQGYDRRGGTLLASKWGIGAAPTDIGGRSGVTTLAPGWYVCQGWNEGSDGRLDTDDDAGHSFFLRVVDDSTILFLESRGKAAGGSLYGQDGVGSRNTTPRHARDWSQGKWPNVRRPYTLAKLQSTYERLWVSRLGDDAPVRT